jgi:hypothetical protein
LRRNADGPWTRPATLTSWSKDVPQDLMLTSTGAIRYSYLRYLTALDFRARRGA